MATLLPEFQTVEFDLFEAHSRRCHDLVENAVAFLTVNPSGAGVDAARVRTHAALGHVAAMASLLEKAVTRRG